MEGVMLGWTHWLIVLIVVVLLFGGSGKLSAVMADVAKGIKSFRKGLSEDDKPQPPQNPPLSSSDTEHKS